jgi:tRNA (guanine-N7-)-methyltransferase
MPLDVYHSICDQRLADLRADFLPRLQGRIKLTLEIGCGHGHYLSAYAAAHPAEFCVGIDLIADRIDRAGRKTGRARLDNVAWVQAEAGLFLDALPREHRLERVFLLFSDPWPKRRHWKHRVMQAKLLNQLLPLTEPGAAIHFRTDHSDYFDYARDQVRAEPNWRLAEETEHAWPFEQPSVFQERAGKAGFQSFTALRR